MNQNITGQMRQMLQESVGCTFEKAPDGLGWTCYMGKELVAEHRTLGSCVWEAARELGEKSRDDN